MVGSVIRHADCRPRLLLLLHFLPLQPAPKINASKFTLRFRSDLSV